MELHSSTVTSFGKAKPKISYCSIILYPPGSASLGPYQHCEIVATRDNNLLAFKDQEGGLHTTNLAYRLDWER